MKLTGKSTRSYKKNGNTVFVYTFLNLKPEVLEAFKKAQGDFYREDEAGNPLFFTTRYSGETADFIITTNGKLIVDTSELDKAASLAKQYGGNLGQELARISAAKLLGVTQAESVPAEIVPLASPEDMDKM